MVTKTLKKEWFVIVLLLIPFGVSAYFWDQLPDQVPTHFNISGEPDDWGPKWVIAIMLPVIGFLTYASMIILPIIDPKKRIEVSQKPVSGLRILVTMILLGAYSFTMAYALGYTADINVFVKFSSGTVILLVGNYMNSIKPNYFIGVKTPWTLEDPEVWKRTHRLTSKLYVVLGLLVMISAFINKSAYSEYLLLIIIGCMVIIPIGYSYLIYQKLKRGQS